MKVSRPQQTLLRCGGARKGVAAAHAGLALAICTLQLCSCTVMDTGVGERLSYGPFHEVRIYLRTLPAASRVALSGDGG